MAASPIRPLREDDIGAVLALSRALEADATPCSLWGLTAADVRQWLADPARVVLVMPTVESADTALAGLAAYVRGAGAYQEHLAEVSIAVAPGQRREGIARALLCALEAHARAAGVERLKALVQVENAGSRRLFEGCGFEHHATLYGEFRSERFGPIDDCVYYKQLAATPAPRPARITAAMRCALFLDLGDTLVRVEDDEIYTDDDGRVELLPNTVDVLRREASSFDCIFIITNQSGVEKGRLTAAASAGLVQQVAAAVGIDITDSWACPWRASAYRKPAPGMVIGLADKYFVDLSRSVLVGDAESDRQCAVAAGVGRFVWADEFFGRGWD